MAGYFAHLPLVSQYALACGSMVYFLSFIAKKHTVINYIPSLNKELTNKYQ
jgi:hypothetical protein